MGVMYFPDDEASKKTKGCIGSVFVLLLYALILVLAFFIGLFVALF